MADDFNLEEEYGWFLHGVTDYVNTHPNDFLEHFGVKGMKWGVHKERDPAKEIRSLGPDKVVRKTDRGETLTLSKDRPPAIARFLARHSDRYRASAGNFASMTIHDGNGNKIGDAQVRKVNNDELNLVWLGIDKSARGKGYATAAMKVAAEYGRQAGFKKLTLEVPGRSPDARHIYTKLGFKVVKEATPEEAKADTVWGGLTHMEYQIEEVKHMSYADQILAHNGVKGMKWGHHKAKDTTPSPKAAAKAAKQEHKAWKKQANSSETANKVFQEALKTAEKPFADLANHPNYKGKDLNARENHALAQQYDRDASQLFNDHMAQASMKYASNKHGNEMMLYQFDRNVGMMRATHMVMVDENNKRLGPVEHAANKDWPEFAADMDDNGFITGLTPVAPMAHVEEFTADFLEHYGVKGMKWGVRRDGGGHTPGLLPGARTSMKVGHAVGKKVNETRDKLKKEIDERVSTETTVRTKPGQMVRVVGGNKRGPHDDAIKARVAEQVAKRSTLDALSNQDLQHLVNRMNLEAQYRNLAVKETRKSKGQKQVEELLGSAKADAVIGKTLGPHAAIGKKVINKAFVTVTQNKALQGGSTKKDKNKD